MSIREIVMPNGMELKVKDDSKLAGVLSLRKLDDVNGDGRLTIDDMPSLYHVKDGWNVAAQGTPTTIFYTAITNALVESGDLQESQRGAFYDFYVGYGQSKSFKAFADDIKRTSSASWIDRNFGATVNVVPSIWGYAKNTLAQLESNSEKAGRLASGNNFFYHVYHSLVVFSGLKPSEYTTNACNEIGEIVFNPEAKGVPEILRASLMEMATNYSDGYEALHALASRSAQSVYFTSGEESESLTLLPLSIQRDEHAHLVVVTTCDQSG